MFPFSFFLLDCFCYLQRKSKQKAAKYRVCMECEKSWNFGHFKFQAWKSWKTKICRGKLGLVTLYLYRLWFLYSQYFPLEL